jgi:hypothetical protein
MACPFSVQLATDAKFRTIALRSTNAAAHRCSYFPAQNKMF